MTFGRKKLYKAIYSKCDSFWQETGIGAINNAGKARNSPLRRTIWIIAFCLFSVLSLKGVVTVIQEYRQYPTSTSISIKLATEGVNKNTFV